MRARLVNLSLSLLTVFVAAPAFSVCPTARPVLSGPTVVQRGQNYSLSWTGVLSSTGPGDYYVVQRSGDPDFAASVDQINATRPAQTLPSPLQANPSVLYHRIVVKTTCASASPALLVSNTIAVKFTSDCPTPGMTGSITATPPDPPAFTTYVLTWDQGVGGPGPGGGPSNIVYRLRRTSSYDVRESVSTLGTASFSDAPGDYVYEVRAEATCGAPGVWSAPLTVHVGSSPFSSLAVVDQPHPMSGISPASLLSTSFTVRNTGTDATSVTAKSPYPQVSVEPASFTLEPYATQALTVTYLSLAPTSAPFHSVVELRSPGNTLTVPVDVAIGTTAVPIPVSWSDTDIEIPPDGGGVLRSIVNPATVPATVVSSVNQPWIVVENPDGTAWDGVLHAGETRIVRIRVDRTRRHADTGTEVASVTLVTAGLPDQPQVLQVTDDGPQLPVLTGPRPDATGARTRLLYASMPNARDVQNVGRFGSDLWLANQDPQSAIDVALYLTPLGTSGQALTYSFTTRLQPGETRRYRNIVAQMLRMDASCELEVRSTAPTLSTTALVNNTPLAPIAGASPTRPFGTTSAGPGQYGFEMRPTRPHEGVRIEDQVFVVSGIFQSASRRTNVLLTETSGWETTVLLRLFDRFGNAVTKGGAEVALQKIVPALGTIQVNADELFDAGAAFPGSLYARVEFVTSAIDPFGKVHGSVVPFATVIDNQTQSASLRVGVSLTALDPAGSPAPTASGRPALASSPLPLIPFGGGAAPLVFPAAHVIGAPLGSGAVPFWRTRVSFTNTNQNVDRAVLATLYGSDQNRYQLRFALPARATFTIDDLLGSPLGFNIPESVGVYGPVEMEVDDANGITWKDVDVQSETYTLDPNSTNADRGQYATGMEAFSYRHGYSSFQSNLGTVEIEGAENSSRYRTNLVIQEVGGSSCTVAISAYLRGSFVPVATVSAVLPPFGYLSKELFRAWLGLSLREVADVRVVVRQIDGDGVFMAFASRINLTTGDPANVFLRPALAGTGR